MPIPATIGVSSPDPPIAFYPSTRAIFNIRCRRRALYRRLSLGLSLVDYPLLFLIYVMRSQRMSEFGNCFVQRRKHLAFL